MQWKEINMFISRVLLMAVSNSALILNVINMIRSVGIYYTVVAESHNGCSLDMTRSCSGGMYYIGYCQALNIYEIIFYPVWIPALIVLLVIQVNGVFRFETNDMRFFIARDKVKDKKQHRATVYFLFFLTYTQTLIT